MEENGDLVCYEVSGTMLSSVSAFCFVQFHVGRFEIPPDHVRIKSPSEEKDVNEPLTTKNQTMGGQQHWREGRLTTYTEAKVGSTQFGRIFKKYFKFKKNTYNFFSGTIS